MAIRRKGWLAVSFKLKIEKEQKQGGSLITREEGREVGSSASEGNHFGWIQAKKFQIAVFSDKNFLDKVCQSHIRNILHENAKNIFKTQMAKCCRQNKGMPRQQSLSPKIVSKLPQICPNVVTMLPTLCFWTKITYFPLLQIVKVHSYQPIPPLQSFLAENRQNTQSDI